MADEIPEPTTLEQAQELLTAYRAAELKILTGGQEYTIGEGATARTFRRADLATVTKIRQLLESQVTAMTPGASWPRGRISYIRS